MAASINPGLGYRANHPVWSTGKGENIWLDDKYYYIWEGLGAQEKEDFANAGEGYWAARYSEVMRDKSSKAYQSWEKYALEDSVHNFFPVTSYLPLHPPSVPLLPTIPWVEQLGIPTWVLYAVAGMGVLFLLAVAGLAYFQV